jgi:hypothetical protein
MNRRKAQPGERQASAAATRRALAQQIASAIQQNIAQLYERRIEFKKFDEKQRILWDEAQRAGLSREVARLVAPQPTRKR